jgi:hypothetical protein
LAVSAAGLVTAIYKQTVRTVAVSSVDSESVVYIQAAGGLEIVTALSTIYKRTDGHVGQVP